MMLYSVVTLIEDRDGDGDHLPLSQCQIAIAMHEAIVKGHEGSQSGRIQTVRFDDVVYTTPRAHCAFVNLLDYASCFIFGNGFYPGHFGDWRLEIGD
jgi:hypothetical protein